MTLTTEVIDSRATADPWQLGALALAAGIRRRAFSSLEVVQAHLDRIAAVNPALNAITVQVGDAAIAAARVADRALGLPAVAVPVGIGEGLPRVVQNIGPRFGEDVCLDAAQALEERLGVLPPIEPRGRGREVR